MHMEFLKLLETVRFPALTGLLSAITYLGDELCFMALALLFFWCINKRQGYFIFSVGLAGSVINQFLKLWFRIPRPWVLDPEFTIVEAAREAAKGYSFPSGHTQSAVGTFGAIFLCRKEKWLRALCVAAIILVPFSRMYLGVHTPLDVGVSFLVAGALLALIFPLFRSDEAGERHSMPVLMGVIVLAGLYMLFILSYKFPQDVDAHNLESGTKNAYTFLGSLLGLLLASWVDRRYINFSTEAPLIGQILKYIIGLGIAVALKSLLKAPLTAIFNGAQMANLIRYFLMVVFAGCVWPLSFPLFAGIGKKK